MKLPVPIVISDFSQKQWTFETIETFEAFIKSQADFWSLRIGIANTNPTANQYIQRANNFQAILNTISSWRPQFETWDSNTFNSNLTDLIRNNVGQSWVWSGHPYVEKWLELNNQSANTADAFFEAIVGKATSRFASGMEYFQGYLIAYEYINQGKTDINKRRNSEDKSLSSLRDQLIEKQNVLIEKVSSFEEGVTQGKIKLNQTFRYGMKIRRSCQGMILYLETMLLINKWISG